MIALLLALLAQAGPTGTEIATSTQGMDGRERQAVLVDHCVAGHVPEHLLRTTRVAWTDTDTLGGWHTIEIDVLPDYLAVGTDADFLRAPLDLPSAIAVARAWQMVLPTTRMVDQIYAQASERLTPRPIPPSDQMRSVWAYLRHREALIGQGAGSLEVGLRAGHKKDLVLTPRLEAQPDRVAIYGWHRSVDNPIQPLSLWHGAGYTDYSHGVRLIAPTVFVDGVAVDLFDLLADPVLWPLVSDEGPWAGARAMMWPDEPPGYPEYRPDRTRRKP